MFSGIAAFVAFNLLRFRDNLSLIEPEDILDMWHELDADDDRILYYLRIALPSRASGPVPPVPGLSYLVERLAEGGADPRCPGGDVPGAPPAL